MLETLEFQVANAPEILGTTGSFLGKMIYELDNRIKVAHLDRVTNFTHY